MLNKGLYIAILMFSVLLLSGCGQGEVTETDNENETKTTFEETVTNHEKEEVNVTEEKSGTNTSSDHSETSDSDVSGEGFLIAKENYTENEISINYPQISNLDDSNLQEKVNDIIKDEALKVLSYYPTLENELNLEIDYEISRNDGDILSIKYSGLGFVKGAAHPNNLFYTTTIKMENGTRLQLPDLVAIDEIFVNTFKEKGHSPQPEYEVVLKEMSNEDLLKRFNSADSLDHIGTELQTDTFSYLTDDSLGISITVPSALGDHAEYEIKLSDIKDFIKF